MSERHADPSFDRYARMVRRALGVPVALVTLVEEHRQVFPGARGLPEPYQTTRETPLSHSFCQYVVQDDQPLVIADARLDARLHRNLAIPDLGVIAYAGWPIKDRHGRTIGSLCAIDSEPHTWTQPELDALADLAEACSAEMAQRMLRKEAKEQTAAAQRMSRRNSLLLALSQGLAVTRTPEDVAAAVEEVATEGLGCLRAGIWLRNLPDAARISAPEAPRVGARAEVLTLVDHGGASWASAARHSEVPIDEDNPLGRAILDRRTVYYPDRAGQNADFPHLAAADQIGEARAVLPLTVADQVYGAMVLLWDEVQEDLTDEDRVTMRALAGYAAQAVQRAVLHQERVDVAGILQDAMIADLPRPVDLELVARYRPAAAREKVGGDWYDAVDLSTGGTALIVGDVVGHDMAAAAIMGRLRSTLTALTWTHAEETPAEVVTRLDQANVPLQLDLLATLVLARIEQGLDDASGRPTYRLVWTNAGHPPPLLVRPCGEAEFLDDEHPNDCMIGVLPTAARRDQRVDVPSGATLLLYTDGLVERRDEDYEDGLDRLARAAGSLAAEPASELVDGVLATLVGPDPDDDVALLAVRVP